MHTDNQHDELQKDFELANEIERVLLKGKIPPILNSFDMGALTIPLKEHLNGDFFDFYQPHEDLLDIVFGDVMGKGIPAGYVALATKMQFLRFALPVRKKYIYQQEWDWEKFALPIEEIVSRISFFMTPSLMELGFFISLFYGRFNFKEMTFSYIDCGSTKPIHFKGNKAEFLKGENVPFGAAHEKEFHIFTVPFTNKDLFLFYSDGVIHAQNSEKQLLGETLLKNWTTKKREAPSKEILSYLKDNVIAFTENKPFNDDFTLLALKPSKISKKPGNVFTKTFPSSLEELPNLRKWVKGLCRKGLGDTQKLNEKIVLVLNEAFCNICLHAYEGEDGHDILVIGTIENDGLRIDIKDWGISFDPTLNPKPDLSGNRDHGFGLHLMEKLIDQMVYYPKGFTSEENMLTLFKKFEGVEL